MSTIGYSDIERATAVITSLDPSSRNLVMPSLPSGIWTYDEAKQAIIQEFGSREKMANRKQEFFAIQFKRNESVVEFADRFYHEAQVLLGAKAMDDFDAKIALQAALKPYRDLHRAMISALNKDTTTLQMVEFLRLCGMSFDAPNRENKGTFKNNSQPQTGSLSASTSGNAATKSATSQYDPKVKCNFCGKVGHKENVCRTKQRNQVNVVQDFPTEQSGKEQAE